MAGKTIIDKIWDRHIVRAEPGAPDAVFIDVQLLHEVTSPQAFAALEKDGVPVMFPSRQFATVDHSTPTDTNRTAYVDAQAKTQVEKLRENVKKHGIQLFDFDSGAQGIVHVIGPELGITQPGRTLVCGDSHTSTHGAFGALAFGIGTTQVQHVLASQCLLLDRPRTMKVEFIGTPGKYFTAKDAVLALIRQIGVQGGTGYALEYTGAYVESLSMEGRMTLCNMSIECGARFGLVAPDGTTFAYMRGRRFAPEDFDVAVEKWKELRSDADAEYDAQVVVDITGLSPMVTWGTNPAQVVGVNEPVPALESFTDADARASAEKALAYTKVAPGAPLAGLGVDFVFIGSCTNSRIEDMRVVAEVLRGKKCDPRVKVFIVPGSEAIRARCIEEGLDRIFTDAGADFRMAGCSMCIAMNGDIVPEGARCASTSNRNFVGRQGQGSITHLMSPLMAALCAVHGCITDPGQE